MRVLPTKSGTGFKPDTATKLNHHTSNQYSVGIVAFLLQKYYLNDLRKRFSHLVFVS